MAMAGAGLVEGPDGITRCAWHGNLPDYLAYHDQRMGAAGRRRYQAVREDLPGGFPVRPVLADDPAGSARISAPPSPASTSTRSPNSPRPMSSACFRTPVSSAIAARSSRPSTMRAARRRWSPRPARSRRGSGSSSRARRRRPTKVDLAHLRANPTTAVSVRISKELKKRGWTFVGPTTVYAFMQAMGLVNDHIEDVFAGPKSRSSARRSSGRHSRCRRRSGDRAGEDQTDHHRNDGRDCRVDHQHAGDQRVRQACRLVLAAGGRNVERTRRKTGRRLGTEHRPPAGCWRNRCFVLFWYAMMIRAPKRTAALSRPNVTEQCRENGGIVSFPGKICCRPDALLGGVLGPNGAGRDCRNPGAGERQAGLVGRRTVRGRLVLVLPARGDLSAR